MTETKKTYRKDQAAIDQLDRIEFAVTQNDATERPFTGKYWDHKEEGLYVDIVSGEPLFTSMDKFDSHCGWPSFTKPVEDKHVAEKQDYTHGMIRTEVRSTYGDSHLGHVFNDGPAPTGLRYCINSASLRFIPKDRLEAEGYGDYWHLFAKPLTKATPKDLTDLVLHRDGLVIVLNKPADSWSMRAMAAAPIWRTAFPA